MVCREKLVLVAGPGISGRTSSLLRIVEMSNVEVPWTDVVGKKAPVSFGWQSKGGTTTALKAIVFGALSNFHFAGREAVEQNEWARRDYSLLETCDGIVLLLDAQAGAIGFQENFYRRFSEWLSWCGRDLRQIPHVVFLNKTDLDDGLRVLEQFESREILPLDHLFRTVATEGIGIREGFDCLVHQLA